MTEYEYLDFVTSSVEVITQSGFDFISVFFAYLACGYLAGTKLSLMQAIALTMAYTIYLSFCVMTVATSIGRIIGASTEPGSDTIARFELMQIAGPTLLTFIWLVSVIYMFSQYRKGLGQTSSAT